MKKLLVLLFLIMLTVSPVIAAEKFKMIAKINQEFSTDIDYKEVEFKTIKKTQIPYDIVIPQRSIIIADYIQSQKERRWHKGGFIVCKLKYFITDYPKKKVNLEDKNIYLIVRKYDKINGKEVAITSSEVVLSAAASFFVPGIDIAYYFTKGAIQRKKNKSWFKAGVSNAYDNSIFWFWLKGKPIELDEGDTVSLKEIKEKRAFRLKSQIEKRKAKKAQKAKRKNI